MKIKSYGLVTGAYWSLTLTDGALRMVVLLHFHELGFGPLELSFLFLSYEFMGILTNLFGGIAGSKFGLEQTLKTGLLIQIFALIAISFVQPSWGKLLSVAFVMSCQAFSGIAKDLTKMSSKSAVKFVVPEDGSSGRQSRLFRWVAVLTGSKNALKGVGFFVGSALLSSCGYRASLLLLASIVAAALLTVLVWLDESIGKSSKSIPNRIWASTYPAVNRLSIARFFLFGSRDIWFVVALPIFLDETLGWSFEGIGAFLAVWVIGYGIIQSGAPSVIRLKGASDVIQISTRLWSFILMLFTILLTLLVANDIAKSATVIVGLLLFGVLFALNSSLHSYLILAFTEDDNDVAVNVGLYYSANAFGRLFGTLLSGLTYLWGGLSAALFTCCVFLAANWLISFSFPKKIAAE
ncbi:MAG: MFS transporter [Acidimicrobiaceae bacterium]|nr:MFS transporter [Acidimicrobiaceae bacterium]